MSEPLPLPVPPLQAILAQPRRAALDAFLALGGAGPRSVPAPALPHDVAAEVRGELRVGDADRLLERRREAQAGPHEPQHLEDARLAVARDEELRRVVRGGVDEVRLVLVERLRVDDGIALFRGERARDAAVARHAVARARQLLLVERVQVLDAAVAVALPGGHAREALAEPARDLLVHPGEIVSGELIRHAVGQLVGDELIELSLARAEEAPGAGRLDVDGREARPGAEPAVTGAVHGALQRLVARMQRDGDRLAEPAPARDPRRRLLEGVADLARRAGVFRPVDDPEAEGADGELLRPRLTRPGEPRHASTEQHRRRDGDRAPPGSHREQPTK